MSLFDVIWGQCSPMMQVKLKVEFTARGKSIDDKDVMLLLKAIKGVSHRCDSTINPYEAVDEGKRKWYALHQGPNDSPVDFLTYLYLVELIEVISPTILF